MRLPLVERGITNRAMSAMIPHYVHAKDEGEDHKCGSCSMRVEIGEGDKAYCTIVVGDISLMYGTCNYWAPDEDGEGEPVENMHESKMSKETAGYVEVDGPVRCDTCDHYANEYCRLWEGDVKAADCCTAWESAEMEGMPLGEARALVELQLVTPRKKRQGPQLVRRKKPAGPVLVKREKPKTVAASPAARKREREKKVHEAD